MVLETIYEYICPYLTREMRPIEFNIQYQKQLQQINVKPVMVQVGWSAV